MADYTFGTVAVYDAAPGANDKVVTNAVGGKLVLVKDGPAQPITDLNGTPITEITSNSDGQSSQFRAQVRRGLIQFGDLVVTVWANEVANELDQISVAVATAQAAVDAAQQAVLDAQEALLLAQQGGGGTGGGLPENTTLEDIPNGISRIAMTIDERNKLASTPTSFLTLGTTSTTAKRGDYAPTAKDVGAVVSMSGDVRLWTKRTTTQGPPSVAEGAVPGTDYVFLDVV